MDLHIQLGTTKKLPLINVFNKTDAFPFKVNRYGYPDSGISTKVHGAVILTQLIRFARICTEYQEFILKCKELFQTLLERNFQHQFLIGRFLRFVACNTVLLLKYFVPTKMAIMGLTTDVFGNH